MGFRGETRLLLYVAVLVVASVFVGFLCPISGSCFQYEYHCVRQALPDLSFFRERRAASSESMRRSKESYHKEQSRLASRKAACESPTSSQIYRLIAREEGRFTQGCKPHRSWQVSPDPSRYNVGGTEPTEKRHPFTALCTDLDSISQRYLGRDLTSRMTLGRPNITPRLLHHPTMFWTRADCSFSGRKRCEI